MKFIATTEESMILINKSLKQNYIKAGLKIKIDCIIKN